MKNSIIFKMNFWKCRYPTLSRPTPYRWGGGHGVGWGWGDSLFPEIYLELCTCLICYSRTSLQRRLVSCVLLKWWLFEKCAEFENMDWPLYKLFWKDLVSEYFEKSPILWARRRPKSAAGGGASLVCISIMFQHRACFSNILKQCQTKLESN